jgi:hypothetical protein
VLCKIGEKMRIKAAPDCRLAYWQQGRLIRWKYIDEKGLFDVKAKRYISEFAEVDEYDYYIKAIGNGSAIEEKKTIEIHQDVVFSDIKEIRKEKDKGTRVYENKNKERN